MEQFVTRHDLGAVRHAADPDAEIWAAYGVPAQPAWVFVDGETGQSERVLGTVPPDELLSRLDALEGRR